MSIREILGLARHHAPTDTARPAERSLPAHVVESGYRADRCRFEVACSCGAIHDTPFIDEALEWRELHLQLAPLADQLPD